MKRNLIVRQRDARDCGICCLLSVIKYYNGYVPLEKLRMDTYTNNAGTTFYHLINALKKYGFEATGMKIDMNFLDKQEIRKPFIAHLLLKNNMTHFVVVYKVTNHHVIIMDPSIGFTKLRRCEFQSIWTNRVIIINPIHEILTLPKDKNIFNLFIKILPLEKNLIFKIIITSICLMILSIVTSFYFKILLDEWNTKGTFQNSILIIFGSMILMKIILKYIRKYFENYLNKNIDIRIIPEFIKHIFFLPLNIVKSRTTGEIVTRISDLNNIKNLFSVIFVTILLDLLLAFTAMFVLYMINSSLFFVLCLIILIYLIVSVSLSPVIYKNILKNIDAETEFNSNLIENIEGILTIKNTNQTDYVLTKINEKFTKYLRVSFNLNNLLNVQSFIKDFINEIGLFVITSYGIYLITIGELTILDLVTFNTLLVYLIEPVKNVIDLLPSINHLRITLSKTSEFSNLEREDTDKVFEQFENGDIVISNLNYSYNDYDYLLKDINLNIKNNSSNFVMGPSGSGKSTICKLIYRLIDNKQGNITINGINIRDYKLNTIRENITYLAQKEILFSDTIRNNILFERNVSNEKFNKIINICRVNEIVDNKPLRLETLMLDGGFNFSGGERQRITLARALVKNSKILILDEVLSEVEEKLEKAIIKDILKEFKDKTIIYISHRDNKKLFNNVIKLGEV